MTYFLQLTHLHTILHMSRPTKMQYFFTEPTLEGLSQKKNQKSFIEIFDHGTLSTVAI